MKELYHYTLIKQLVDSKGNKKRVALKLGYTTRHINRLISGYKSHGKSFFVHGNVGRKPAHTLPETTKQLIIDLYNTKYHEANFLHFTELLAEHENLIVSENAIRTILHQATILSPMATKAVKKRMKAQLKRRIDASTSTPETKRLKKELFLIDDPHPRRPRCAYFGEMIQMDASEFIWFGKEIYHLHVGIDDSTGTIVAAYFDKQETLHGYYSLLHQTLTNYGIPYMFYTDKRTVFEYKLKNKPALENDTFTQFSYACHQLGIALKTTSVPQAKGRVERVFKTLQSRLPIELRLADATNVEQANSFLNSYIKKFNSKFALQVNFNKSVFEKQPSDRKINLTLAVLTKRIIDNGHCLRLDNKYYRLLNRNGFPEYYHKGTPALIIKAFDGSLFASVHEKMFSLEEIPLQEQTSLNFSMLPFKKKPTKRYVPSMSHPWRYHNFKSFVEKQEQDKTNSFEETAYSIAIRS